jgi:hypothetical protein
MINKIVYAGWIDIPNGVEYTTFKRLLRELGVGGILKFNRDRYVVEGLVCEKEIVLKIKKELPTFWAPAFTGYCLYTGEDIKYQEFWTMK